MKTKKCKICGKEKILSNFSKDHKSKEGVPYYYKTCNDCLNKKYDTLTITHIICITCGNEKPLSAFQKVLMAKNGYRNDCKKCRERFSPRKGRRKGSKILSPEEQLIKKKIAKEYQKEYRKNNPEKIRVSDKAYRSTDEFKKISRDRTRDRRKKFPWKHAIRRVLGNTLRQLKGKIKKDNKTVLLLGYNCEQLKQRIECQFKEGMSWKNAGKWHIDHKKPISLFKEGTPIRIVNALCNLQPLWAFDNLSKHNNRIG